MPTLDLLTSPAELAEAEVEELWRVYDPVFGDRDHDSWAEGMLRQVGRAGFRLARARDEGGSLVGWCHGHTGAAGQWWTDRAAAALPPEVAATWLGGHFELIELAVLPEHRRRGLARRLLHLVTDDLPHDRWLLSTTADAADPARRLYDALGWQVLGPLADDVVVMGRRRG